ncbi:alpha-beta hydrolase superfamily lysophospholipase [Agromyces sp. 3263]|uniref:alpha/beta hydrolase family protein n=1 Tax=Agromyces sp. 3263 TaxID=2817750 RepID=UPI002857FAAA|nr:alpha/beta fold hydrolase [Agromyces sp. 3263]MDR6907430.1 alpha-beta hydrolase superfamily lysophospholipase [Agromyces sp. 3263]
MGRGADSGSAVRIAGTAIGLLAAAVGAVAAVTTVVMARRVVTPSTTRTEDVRILSVDLPRGEIVLAASAETRMAGRYGLWFERDSGHARLGEIVDETDRVVRRRLDGVDFGRLDRAGRGRLSGWYHLGPWELGHEYENVLVETPLGPAPAWFVPAPAPSTQWVVQVHGRGAKRQEGLRAVDPARDAGWNTLVVSYRNDGEAPESADRRYGLGGTEWADVVAAVRYAEQHGAERIVLMGWSMGGSIVLQAVLRSAAVRERLVGVILDSPAIDWVDILRFQGTLQKLPPGYGDIVVRLLGGPWSGGLTGLAAPISVEELDPVARADELDVPILLMHSQDDGYVPIDGSRRLAAARPDLIEFEVFEGARHTKLWNHDPARWTRLVRGWLERSDADVRRLAEEAEIAG